MEDLDAVAVGDVGGAVGCDRGRAEVGVVLRVGGPVHQVLDVVLRVRG